MLQYRRNIVFYINSKPNIFLEPRDLNNLAPVKDKNYGKYNRIMLENNHSGWEERSNSSEVV